MRRQQPCQALIGIRLSKAESTRASRPGNVAARRGSSPGDEASALGSREGHVRIIKLSASVEDAPGAAISGEGGDRGGDLDSVHALAE